MHRPQTGWAATEKNIIIRNKLLNVINAHMRHTVCFCAPDKSVFTLNYITLPVAVLVSSPSLVVAKTNKQKQHITACIICIFISPEAGSKKKQTNKKTTSKK